MHENGGEFPINPHNPPFGSKFFPWNTIDIGFSLAMFDYGRVAELSRKLETTTERNPLLGDEIFFFDLFVILETLLGDTELSLL